MATIRFDVSETGGDDAIRRILGDNFTGRYPEFIRNCPRHDDDRPGGRPSLSITFRLNRVGVMDIFMRCHSCETTGLDVARELGIDWAEIQYAIPAFVTGAERDGAPKQRWALPRLSYVDECHADLLAGGEALEWLTEVRGISIDVARRFKIGWDARRRWVIFPTIETWKVGDVAEVPTVTGCLWYPLDGLPDGTRKMCCWGGHGHFIYPEVPPGDFVAVCEGPPDALAGISNGVPAVSGTGGASHFPGECAQGFSGRSVVVIYDSDEAGRRGAERVASVLRPVARTLTVVDLAPERDDGYDLTDWFRDGRTTDELKSLIRAARRRESRFRPGLSRLQPEATNRAKEATRG